MSDPTDKTDQDKAARAKIAQGITIYFSCLDGSYLFPMNGRYIPLKKTEIFTELTALGLLRVDWLDANNGRLDAFEWVLWNSRNKYVIDYAGGLAGHKAGIFEDGGGKKFLALDQAQGVFDKLEKHPDPAWFIAFIQELLPEGQATYFLYWLAFSLRALRAGDMRPGQVVFLAGPGGCGKSLLQLIITEILGGRSAGPLRYMTDLTPFNADLAGAEHWMIEDPGTTTDIRTRRNFGSKIKEATVNRNFSIHGKTKTAITLPLFRRVTISVNDEPENLAIIPPLEPGINDKLFLFHCARASASFDAYRNAAGDIDQAKNWADIRAEVPAIRAWLLKQFNKVPKAMRDDRFGIKAWHHPELTEELSGLSPETRFLQLIDDVIFSPNGPDLEPEFKSSDLEKLLRKSEMSFEVEKILRFTGACGTYLGKLSKSSDRISKRKVHGGTTLWTITPPNKTTDSSK